MKKCTKCGEIKALGEFNRRTDRKSGFGAVCLICHRAIKRKYRVKYDNTENGAMLRKHYRLQKRYGISMDQYLAMVSEQQGLCAICQLKLEKKLVVDHDHNSGKIRRLICGACNKGLGMFKDNAAVLRAAASYLEKWSN